MMMSIGVAMTDDPSATKPWERLPKPVMTPGDAYAADGRRVVYVGVNYDPAKRTDDDVRTESAR